MTVVVPDFERSMEELNRRATEVAGALNVAHANAIELLADALESGAWFQAGIRSPEHWLAWQMGVSPSRASAWVAMARRRAELPVTFEAFDNGELAVDQVSVVVNHIPTCATARSTPSCLASDATAFVRTCTSTPRAAGSTRSSAARPLLSELLCDGVVHPVWTVKGVPINVGPSTPVIPDHLRRIVLDRDRVCRCCGSSLGIHLHHVVHREHLGPTQSGNLVGLCQRCHRAHHRGEIIVSLAAGTDADDPDGLIITRADGSRFGPAPPIPPPGGRPPGPPDGHRYAHPLGERMDFDAIVFNEPPSN